jgi:mannose-6-phosphate isomerase-like protein (cupin superfamily)
MTSFTGNIKNLTLENDYFRKVLYTAQHCQLVVMSLKPSEDIGEETHTLDQVLFFLEGTGKAYLNDVQFEIYPGSVFVVPAGTKHNFINSDSGEMKLYTVYAPAEHRDGTVHETKDDALRDKEDHV